jgi:uncharacterized protein YraI
MGSYDVTDAFNDCIDRLHAGQSIDDCLHSYPQYVAILRPLLEMAEIVREANPVAPSTVRARVRTRVIESTEYLPQRHDWPRSLRVTLVAASLATVILVAILVAVFNRQSDRRLHIVPLSTGSPTATPTLTADPSRPTLTVTPTATATPTQMPTVTAAPSAAPTATASTTPAAAPPVVGVSPVAGQEASPAPAETIPASPSGEAGGGAGRTTACLFTVNISSVYLRSGPGTGYGAVGFGYAGDEFPVLAQHTSDLWLLVQADSGEVWVATSVGTLSGDCTDLPISDTPLRSESSSGSDSVTATEVPPAAGDTASTPEDNSGHDGGEDSSHSGEGGGS